MSARWVKCGAATLALVVGCGVNDRDVAVKKAKGSNSEQGGSDAGSPPEGAGGRTGTTHPTSGGATGAGSRTSGGASPSGVGGTSAGEGGAPTSGGGGEPPSAGGGVSSPGSGGTPMAPPGDGGSAGTVGTGGRVGAGGQQGAGGSTGTGGRGTGGTGAGGAMSTGGAPTTGKDPVLPAITETCPAWTNSTITFMDLPGILISAGTKPASASAPMLVYWHGTGSTSGEYTTMASPVANGVLQAGGVIVSFQGTTGGDILSGTSIFGAGDLKLVDQLVACAVRDHNIDKRRIYTMGCSAGGLFATAMAAMRSSYVAAVAPNSGGEVTNIAFQTNYTPPLMTVHGAKGKDVVITDFSVTSATADMNFKTRGGFVIDCDTGGGHCSGGPLAGEVWKFFQAHPYGVSPEPWAGGLPAGFSSQCLRY